MKTLIDAFVVMTFAVFGVYGLVQDGPSILNKIKKEALSKASSDLVTMSRISGQLTRRK
jgi:hypothetical protein